MTDKERSFDLEVAHEAVAKDVAGVLGAFLDGKYEPDRSIGESNWRGGSSEFFAIRWRFMGRHTGDINGFGHTKIRPTQNEVSVSGLTLVENTKPGQVVGDLDEVLKSDTCGSTASSTGWQCSPRSACCTSAADAARRHPLHPTRTLPQPPARLNDQQQGT